MSAHSRPLVFQAERDLEDYLETHLSPILSLLGLEVMIIGRQIEAGARRAIDLLAIDATGVLYIVELKLHQAGPTVTTQVLVYRRWIKRLERTDLIRVVSDGRLHINLETAFRRHFGHPLPETVNESQVLVIIGDSIHPGAATSILELKDEGRSVAAFRYVVQSGVVSLVPCCRDDHDVDARKSHIGFWPPASPAPHRPAMPNTASPYTVCIDENFLEFWLTQAQSFVGPLVTFKIFYERYRNWRHAQAAGGVQVPLLTQGLFGRQLAAMAGTSGEWMRVFIAPGNENVHEPLTARTSVRTHRDADHRIVAYQRNNAA